MSVSNNESGDQVMLAVKDHGVGIAEEDLPKIFDKFYRCDRSRSVPGIGLGLSLCKAIVKMHEGRFLVDSKPEKGSTFTVILPCVN